MMDGREEEEEEGIGIRYTQTNRGELLALAEAEGIREEAHS